MSVLTALGRGPAAQLSGVPAFAEVSRFDTSQRRTHHAATASEVGTLEEELDLAIATACTQAGVDRGTTPLLLALHTAPKCDFGQRRVYTSACVSASTALADAATLIRLGRLDRVVVAAAYLVEPYQYALFDTGRALSTDGAVRPFCRRRTGTLLGDGVAAVVLEAGEGLAELAGWARTGDAHHPVQPAPDGRGLEAAIRTALHKANLTPADLGYLNANAPGTTHADAAEAAALTRLFPPAPFEGSTPTLVGCSPGTRRPKQPSEGSTPELVGCAAGRRGVEEPFEGSAPEVVGCAPGMRRPKEPSEGSTPELAGCAAGMRGEKEPAEGLAPEVVGCAPGMRGAKGQPEGLTPQTGLGQGLGQGLGRGLGPGDGVGGGVAGGGAGGAGCWVERDRVRGRMAGHGGPAVSSTKGLHGHALEASGLVEFVVTVQALREGKLPVNAGFLEGDPGCELDLVLGAPRLVSPPYGMSVNSAFGGANTALVVRVG